MKTSFFRPMYVFNQQLGTTSFEECREKCPTIEGNAFKKGEMHIPCITSFDMNHQLLAWMTKKYGPVKTFAWIGHKTDKNGDDGKWVDSECEKFQANQARGDMVDRNGCAFSGNTKEPNCSGTTSTSPRAAPSSSTPKRRRAPRRSTSPRATSRPTSSSTATGSSRRTASTRTCRPSARARRSTASARRSCKSRTPRLRGDAPPPSSLTVHPARWGPS